MCLVRSGKITNQGYFAVVRRAEKAYTHRLTGFADLGCVGRTAPGRG
jgi:hypothetical protein